MMLQAGTWRSMVHVSLLLTCSMLYGLVQCRTSYYHARYRANWYEAKEACESIGGSLLKLEDDTKRLYMRGLFGSKFYGTISGRSWIGLNDIDKEGDFRWLDGTPLSFHNKWRASMTTTVDTSDCVYMDWFNIVESRCTHGHSYICQVNEDSWEGRLKADIRSCWVANDIIRLAADEDTETVVNCARNKTYFSPSHRSNLMTWDEANAYCKEANGSLAKITSFEEQEMVNRIRSVHEFGYMWIGLTDRVTEGVYTWADGEPATWPSSYVTPSQPTINTNENCIGTGEISEWLDFECSTRQPILCERDVAMLPMNQVCLWRIGDNHLCTEQERNCQDAGGTLVHVKSMHQFARLRGKIWTNTCIGFKADNVSGQFKWTDGTVMTWSMWQSDQPSGVNGSEPYGGTNPYRSFGDYPETAVMAAVCQKEVFQFRNAYIVHEHGSITVRCHKYCAFQDGSRISVTSEEEGCLCPKENTWTVLEPWLAHLDTSVLQDEDNTTCLSIEHSIQAMTLSNKMIFDSDFETDIVLSPDIEHLRGDVLRIFTSTDINSVSSTCQLSGGLKRCKHLWGLTYACKCDSRCRLYVKVFQPVGPNMRVTICDVDFILWY